MRRAIGTRLALLASLAAAASSSFSQAIVENPAKPIAANAGRVIVPEEALAISDEGRSDYYFKYPQQLATAPDGSPFVIDENQLLWFGPDGAFKRNLFKKGQGPGELQAPRSVSIDRGAGELAVLQTARRMSFFKLDGTFLRQLSFKEIWALYGAVDSRGHIYVTEGIVDEKDPRYEVKMLGPDGSVIAMLARSPAPVRASGRLTAFTAVAWFVVDRGDRLVYGYPEAYEIQYFGPAGPKLFKRITREYDPVAVTEKERRDWEKQNGRGPGQAVDFAKDHSAYDRFFASDDGHLFVRTWEKDADGKRVHDVFDAEGRFIGRVPLKPLGLEMLKGKYYALEEDEEGYPYIKRYAVTWKVR